MVKVVITRITQMAATKARATIIGTSASIIASKGVPRLFYLRLFLIYSDVMLIPPAENTTKKMTAMIRRI